MADNDLTVGEYLAHLSQSLVHANIEAMKMLAELASSNDLDVEVPLGGRTIELDGTTLTPQGFFALDELEIECESDVQVSRDDDGTPTGLAMVMKRGLMRRNMRVKFRAKFKRGGTIEAVEILRDAGNEALRQSLAQAGIMIKVKE